ncbi:BA14K family protein [Phyllobacterium salinisoli]|uniref:Lectin-like protein BA14k n=1 Tax=Phyllobacterium salinisoli TaxID=1899321 RepID=A0A368KCT7_9HYPH|nr:BA14K family protein [Phyllobacterium salinisoli]RCS25900.1 BA14K family protein [Phyllobacterium salinisoli]
MNRIVKAAVLAAASVAAVVAPLSMTTASAGDWGNRGGGGWGHHRGGWGPGPAWGGRPYYRHRNRSGDAWAAGAIGLAAGALIGSAMSQPQYAPPPPIIYDQPPVYGGYYAPAPRRVIYQRSVGFQPWSNGWYNYCSNRYRSFNPRTGTYRGYDGADHFCTAN